VVFCFKMLEPFFCPLAFAIASVQPSSCACFICLNLSFARADDVRSSFDSGSPNAVAQAQVQSAVDRNLSLSQLHLGIGLFEIKFDRRPGLLTKGARSCS
jgi:hypothetical protein